MGIELQTSIQAVDKLILTAISIIQAEIIRSLSYLGEWSVRFIRDRDGTESWFDITGNLRSSIGYVVAEDGRKVIESAFETILKGSAGSEAGRRAIDAVLPRYKNTFALIMVAGMEYAEFVEAKENKDVLAKAELKARAKLQDVLNMAQVRASQKINAL